MKSIFSGLSIAAILTVLPGLSCGSQPQDVTSVFAAHCASCHGASRLGGMGPALLPENLQRLKKPEALGVIAKGRAATQMPSFSDKLSQAEIDALVEYIYSPLPDLPVWGAAEIKNSHILDKDASGYPDKPVFKVDDPLNLFIVVELGDHSATLLDGDKFEPIHRFKTRFALHGGPKYSPSGRYVYFASRDGWISKYDIYNLKTVAEIRAGINTRNLAVSADGRYVMVGNYLPHNLVLLDAEDLKLIRIFDVNDGKGTSSRVSAVYTAPPRESFIVALKDIPEVWEISYSDNPEPVAKGLVHDYRLGEGAFDMGPFPVRRIKLDDYLDDFFFNQAYTNLMGAARNAKNGQVINMDIGRKIADLDLSGLPHLGSGIEWAYQGKTVMATPNLRSGNVDVIDMTTWKVIKTIKTLGPGFFMRSHDNSPYAWVDVFFGANKDAIHVIDKNTLEIVKTLRPEQGKTAAHVEFDRHGKHVLLSIWDDAGAVIVYKADTLEEVKRIPMKKPSGKYNIYNKTRYTSGTSH